MAQESRSVSHPHQWEPLLDSDINRHSPPLLPPLPHHRDDDERAEHGHADRHAHAEEQQRLVLRDPCAELAARPIVRVPAGQRSLVSGRRKAAVSDDVPVHADRRFGSRVMSGGAEETELEIMMVLKLPDIKPFQIDAIQLTSCSENRERDQSSLALFRTFIYFSLKCKYNLNAFTVNL